MLSIFKTPVACSILFPGVATCECKQRLQKKERERKKSSEGNVKNIALWWPIRCSFFAVRGVRCRKLFMFIVATKTNNFSALIMSF